MIAQGTLVVSDRINGCVYYDLADIEVIEEAGLRPIPMSKNLTPLGGKTSKARRKPYNRDMSFLYAEAFRMFREKATLKDVVTALQLTPQQVDQMYAEYMQPDLDERQKNRDVYRIIRVV